MNTSIPRGFTLPMALLDTVPVLFFCASTGLIAFRFSHLLFILGALSSICAGCGKVAWKLFLSLAQKDFRFLTRPFPYLMGGGFLLMLLSFFLYQQDFSWSVLRSHIFTFPSLLFFITGILLMFLMGILGKKYSRTDARGNWIEECVNVAAQLFFFLGILFC